MEEQSVRLWEEKVNIPTYETGKPEKNPIFSERRVYQGSSGKVYPYPVIEKIYDEKVNKEYTAVFLENQYIKVMILPELGGRIQRAYDKTNGYDFVYYNRVIKPALVGLTGPWISGGIEFNWPQHHRPTTFLPIDYILKDNKDGSKTVFVNDVDQIYGTKGITGITLYSDKAYIEIKGQLYNRTPLPQTFLWWANPAVSVNDNTQSIFPPDVHAVMDHGKRDVSRFPIATGVYYKQDYSAGVDISRYKNIPVPTSYMAEKSDFDFMGGYDYGVNAGVLHVADHHVSPGKKQWTWGNGNFGKAWDRNLTDEDGPYIELMAGVYTDNQPDFTWLKPFEEKTFKQYFMPYKAVGAVKNATIHAVVNMEVNKEDVSICVYATSRHEKARVILEKKGSVCFEEVCLLSPVDIFEKSIPVIATKDTDFTVKVYDENNKILVDYTPLPRKTQELPKPAQPAANPEDIMTNEELYLTGIHIEQYRHATYLPDAYYLEGLKRDSGDIRINTAYGSLLLSRGLFDESETYFRQALKRMTWKNPNPYNSEAYYKLGLTLLCQNREKEAYDAFYKATWSNEQQEMSFYFLSAITCRKNDMELALELAEKCLVKNTHNMKARGLKTHILRILGRKEEALQYSKESITVDPFDYLSAFEQIFLTQDNEKRNRLISELNRLMRGYSENYIQTARDYAEMGAYREAIIVLDMCREEKPMLKYYQGYYFGKLDKKFEAGKKLEEAAGCCPDYCFPNKLEDIAVFEYAIQNNPADARAPYFLGNLYYDKRQYIQAKKYWEAASKIDEKFPTVFRNLSLTYYNQFDEGQKAKEAMEKAFFLDTSDSRVLLELDQLYKKLGYTVEQRLEFYEKYPNTFQQRDDVFIEYLTLLNFIGRYEKAYQLLMERKLHPWEGGEGKAAMQYTTALVEMARESIKKQEYTSAIELLKKALVYPDNLGEGKLEGAKDNHIYYYLGCAYQALGQEKEARSFFELTSAGTDEPAGMMYYNDQPADMILYQGLAKQQLGKAAEANARFYRLIDYGERHLFDKMKLEYFAVSYPDFMIFKENFTRKNEAHCYFLIGLGNIGLGNIEEAKNALTAAMKLDIHHLKCKIFSEMI